MLQLAPDELAADIVGRLELVADSYLSVSTPVQLALPKLLERRHAVHAELSARLAANLATLDAAIAQAGISLNKMASASELAGRQTGQALKAGLAKPHPTRCVVSKPISRMRWLE